ncbi:unnamed protein product [Prunus armeniaca]|uniref:Uncharacterized protein n=1 Tax=Prunus armeniaca TaxID=36596 RepID=A0A6J5UQT3_PRUAR|nr:unnamed protein product [Prunus armeniaca]
MDSPRSDIHWDPWVVHGTGIATLPSILTPHYFGPHHNHGVLEPDHCLVWLVVKDYFKLELWLTQQRHTYSPVT